MAQGLLKVQGRIPLAQFWPKGEADADTTKVKVEVSEGAFRFREHPRADFRITHAFDKARVRGRVTKDIIDKKSQITIRLQGVDAPEFHYMPQAPKRRAIRPRSSARSFSNGIIGTVSTLPSRPQSP
jgi:hypothetical protein